MITAASSRVPISAGRHENAPERKPALLVVIYANPDYYPPTVNAVRVFAAHFNVKIIARNMEEPFVAWPDGVSVLRLGEFAKAVAKEALPPLAKLAEFWAFIRAVRREIAESRPAVVYAYDAHAFVAAIGVAKRLTVPVFLHLHELPELNHLSPASLQTWVTRFAKGRTPDANSVVVPEANRGQLWMHAAGDTRQAVIVPNCARRDFFARPNDLEKLTASRFAACNVLYVGNMSAQNGQAEAIRAIAMIGRPVSLNLVGPSAPGFAAELESIASKLGLDERVQIYRWVPHDELAERFAHCGVGLSLYKPVSQNWEFNASATNKLIEYAAMGIPAVVPDRNSYREFLKSESWVAYANPEDPASIARAIEFIFADRERYIAMGLAARQAHEEKYNYETVFQPVLERLLKLARPRDAQATRFQMARS